MSGDFLYTLAVWLIPLLLAHTAGGAKTIRSTKFRATGHEVLEN